VRWRHFERRSADRWTWELVPGYERAGMLARLDTGVRKADAVLRDEIPQAGWISKVLAGDGKYWPCGKHAQGAEPAWIWTGDVW